MPTIRDKVQPDTLSIQIFSDGYNALDVSDLSTIALTSQLLADKQNHINGIENFGTKRSIIYANLTRFQESIFTSFWKSVIGDLITVTQESQLKQWVRNNYQVSA